MISQSELETKVVFGRDTWPFIPSGTRPAHSNNTPVTVDTSQGQQWEVYTLNQLDERLKEFRQDLKSTISWLFAVILSISVGLIFASAFSVPQSPNLPMFALGLTLTAVLVVLALNYLPSDVKMKIVWTTGGTGWIFDERHSKEVIDSLQTGKLSLTSKIKVESPILFGQDMAPYAYLICLANLRDTLAKNKTQFIKITSVSYFGGGGKDPLFLLNISVKSKFGLALRKDPRGRLDADALNLIQALGEARTKTGVYSFDYSPESWRVKGHDFLNGFFTWDTDKIESLLLSQIVDGWSPA